MTMTTAEGQIAKFGAPLCACCQAYTVDKPEDTCWRCAGDWFAEVVQYAAKPVITNEDIAIREIVGSLPAIHRELARFPGLRQVTITPVACAEAYRVKEAERLA